MPTRFGIGHSDSVGLMYETLESGRRRYLESDTVAHLQERAIAVQAVGDPASHTVNVYSQECAYSEMGLLMHRDESSSVRASQSQPSPVIIESPTKRSNDQFRLPRVRPLLTGPAADQAYAEPFSAGDDATLTRDDEWEDVLSNIAKELSDIWPQDKGK